MNFFTVETSEQVMTIDKLKNCGCEIIQVSNGLVVKTSMSFSEIQTELENATVKELDLNDPNLSKDTKLFVGIDN